MKSSSMLMEGLVGRKYALWVAWRMAVGFSVRGKYFGINDIHLHAVSQGTSVHAVGNDVHVRWNANENYVICKGIHV